MSEKIKVMLVDDEQLIRSGLKIMLETYPDIEVIHQAGNGREAFECCKKEVPDVVLMDIRHPLKDLDQQMIEWAVSADLPVMLLLTKADKLSQSARSKQVKMVREAILPFQGDIQVEAFSAQNKIGIDKLAAKLDSWFAPLFS